MTRRDDDAARPADRGTPPPPAPHDRTVARPAAPAVLTGHLPPGAPDHVYLPVEVPPGTARIDVRYSYGRPATPPGVPGNACDIGLFDQRGTAAGAAGFRGWSGGARDAFHVGAADATPGYLPGPVEPGTWHVVLGPYTVAPEGLDYRVEVALTPGPATAAAAPAAHPPQRARGRGRAWYRGDNHLHSIHSDGTRSPARIAELARAAGLDHLTVTDHNTTSSHTAWDGLWGDDLLIMTGEEITTRNGHALAVGTDPGVLLDWRHRARDGTFPAVAARVRAAGGLLVPAHPHARCIGCAWRFGLDDADAVEVWNGPFTAEDEAAVAAWDSTLARAAGPGRRHLPAVGNSDAHRDSDVVGLPQTVVLADELSRTALLAGIRAGRVWIAESRHVELEFSARDTATGRAAGIGGTLDAAPDAEIAVRLSVRGAPGCTVRLITEEGCLHTAELPPSGTGDVAWRTTAGHAGHVRAEVRHPADPASPAPYGPMAALTNPVFLAAAPGDR